MGVHKPVEQNLRTAHSTGNGLVGILKKKPVWTIVLAVVFFVILLVLLSNLTSGRSQRSESYKRISGGAGLNATISYDCKKSCEQKFSFNVYILTENGQQVSVVRPDNEGRVRLALPEGNYVMLIGKQLGNNKLFPQEPILLKNGQELELKLQYKEVG